LDEPVAFFDIGINNLITEVAVSSFCVGKVQRSQQTR
jgi:hypothetical protein